MSYMIVNEMPAEQRSHEAHLLLELGVGWTIDSGHSDGIGVNCLLMKEQQMRAQMGYQMQSSSSSD
jgi:hypothetical protein